MRKTKIFAIIAVVITVAFSAINAEDWPIWRGPDKNGISKEKFNPDKITDIAWRKELGAGYSSFAVEGNMVYTMGNKDKNNDTVYCLDAESGREIWTFQYKCKAGGGYAGPRSTPVLDNGRLYTLSKEGHVHCLDAKTGAKIWDQNVNSLGAENIKWQYSGSVVVVNGIALINAGARGIALDAKTGEKKWASSGKGGYAAPVVFNNGQYGAFFSEKSLEIVDLNAGSGIASFPWITAHDVNAADPIVDGDYIFITSGYGRGCALLKLSGSNLTKGWENKALSSHFSSPVLFKGHLYGVNGNTGKGKLVCVNMKDGSTEWSADSTKFGSLMIADGKVIYLDEKGTMTICEAAPSGFKQLASAEVLPGAGKCWTMPVLANGRIFCRGSNGKMVCIKVK